MRLELLLLFPTLCFCVWPQDHACAVVHVVLAAGKDAGPSSHRSPFTSTQPHFYTYKPAFQTSYGNFRVEQGHEDEMGSIFIYARPASLVSIYLGVPQDESPASSMLCSAGQGSVLWVLRSEVVDGGCSGKMMGERLKERGATTVRR